MYQWLTIKMGGHASERDNLTIVLKRRTSFQVSNGQSLRRCGSLQAATSFSTRTLLLYTTREIDVVDLEMKDLGRLKVPLEWKLISMALTLGRLRQ